jgi:hypothetical protein
MAEFTLNYVGHDASRGEIDFYDVAQAMLGFQRSLALTMHLVQNGEIITQAPSLKNGRIFVTPPKEGSWEVVAVAVFSAIGIAAGAPRDTAGGRLTRQVYDYVLRSVLGEDADFDDTFGDDFSALLEEKSIGEAKLDSLIEKAEPAIVAMHRPLIWSQTAQRGGVYFNGSRDQQIGPRLSAETYEYATRTREIEVPQNFEGMVSSYNSNTFKGRIYIPDEGRPIPFELSESTRAREDIDKIASSLRANALDRRNWVGEIGVRGFRRVSSSGRLKSLYIVQVEDSVLRLNN